MNRVVIVGAGFVGAEVAAIARGLGVEVIRPSSWTTTSQHGNSSSPTAPAIA
jgi:phosphoglycerate dehydrogenase-like enzyme